MDFNGIAVVESLFNAKSTNGNVALDECQSTENRRSVLNDGFVTRHFNRRVLLLLFGIVFFSVCAYAQGKPQGGATETTPSHSEYFSWINNTNEGATAAQTSVNLNFFKWLRDRYGMQLDLYAFDAGAIDGAGMYGDMKSASFKRKFPNGFGDVSRQAGEMNTRLGTWCGPDGFGDTEQQAQDRVNMMVDLVRLYHFGLFKMDAVCGQLRPEKYPYFDSLMSQIRQLSPDFVLLNHRLNLGPCVKYSTTYLLGGAETYIDVFMTNDMTAPHHRAKAISREGPEDLTRLTEDHGVCLSSCLDYWEDDLVLQAFGRELILAPEIYGNPWLLKDSEFPYLAFIFNLHRDYRDILVHALRLPEANYGPQALSRGDGQTRFLALRNLTWRPVTYHLSLGKELGLESNGKAVKVRQYHPYVYDLGTHAFGSTLDVTVLPFRAALIKVTTAPERDKVALSGIPYYIVNDHAGNNVELQLLGMPGKTYNVALSKSSAKFTSAQLDGKSIGKLAKGSSVKLSFPGQPLANDYHRLIAEMNSCNVPSDAYSLYDATCFAADNNALEARSLKRSGPTAIPQVQAARDAFFNQALFKQREIWDRNLFDGDAKTGFSISQRWGDARTEGRSQFCLDLGANTQLDSLVLQSFDEYSISPLKSYESVHAAVSSDLLHWRNIQSVAGTRMTFDLSQAGAFRYLLFAPCPLRLSEVTGYKDGKAIDRGQWRANNLFRSYGSSPSCVATKAWSADFVLNEIPKGSYLCIAINGTHGIEGAWAALKIDGKYVGCPDRAPSFTSNPWEYRSNNSDKNYTYYLPLTPDMKGKKIEAWVLSSSQSDLKPETWITAYPIPFEQKTLIMK
jgi:hypothetical protein